MHYEINVSLNGRHLFATHKRSITSPIQMKDVYNIFKLKFPEEEGYKIMVTEIRTTGTILDTNKL